MAGTDTKKTKRRRRRTRTIAVVMEFYLRAVHEGIIRYAREASWILESGTYQLTVGRMSLAADGILCLTVTPELRQLVDECALPTVTLARPVGDWPCVAMDNRAAGRMAAEHLIERGYTHLAYYQPSNYPVADERGEGFASVIESRGLHFHPINWEKARRRIRHGDRRRWLRDQLPKLPKPLGLFCDSDQWAVEAEVACIEADLRVPEQVAVVGVDNDPLYVDVAPVSLTSIDNNLSLIGYEAAAMLDRILDGHDVPTGGVVIPPKQMVMRASTNIYAISDVVVATAVRFIRQHFREAIMVDEIAEECGISLRLLQTKFRQVLGRTIVQEVTHIRLEHALQMLRETTETVDSIARQCGLTSGKYLNEVMKRHIGTTPRHYRTRKG